MKMKGVDMDAIRDMPEPAEKQAWLRTVTILASMVIVLLLIMAGAGLFGQNVYDDFAPPKYVQESRAQDLISLALGIPLLAAALIAVQRGRAWGFPLWAGVLAYELYVYAITLLAAFITSSFWPISLWQACRYTASSGC
jgi:hypothetical protein